MKKQRWMNPRLWAQAVLVILIFSWTLYDVFHGEDLGRLLKSIEHARLRWIGPAVALVLFFIWAESHILWWSFRPFNIRVSAFRCFLFSSVGFFFSCITPSASGGQPMQLYYMKKANIPISTGTAILMLVTITYKFVLVVWGLGLLIFWRTETASYMGMTLPLLYLGIALNIFSVTSMSIMLFWQGVMEKLVAWTAILLEKLRFMRGRNLPKRFEAMAERYRGAAETLRHHPLLIIKIILLTFVQRIALFAVTCFVCLAFRRGGSVLLHALLLQGCIAVCVDMLPLPGGMGVSERLFLQLFPPIFGTMLLPGMILSRGISYYSQLLLSALFTIVQQLWCMVDARHCIGRDKPGV